MIGEKIKSLRLKKRVTQETIANALHVSPRAVSKWELGSAVPDISLLVPLADFFMVTVDYLLRDKAEPKQINQEYFEITLSDPTRGAIKGTLKNLSDFSFEKVRSEIIFRDITGNMIDFRQDYLGNLPAGYTMHISALTLSSRKTHSIEYKVVDYEFKC